MILSLTGITIDTFVSLRKQLETRVADTTEKCFICGIAKNTFNRTLDRDAFRMHTKNDQKLWNYIYFIMYIWEQDKDDDDGLESFVRKCIDNNDLIWFPMNKAIRLAEHQAKGDVNSLKYKFRKDMENTETVLVDHMSTFKDQVNRTIARVEKALEYEIESDNRKSRNQSSRHHSRGNTANHLLNGESHSDSNFDLKLNLHNISTPNVAPIRLATTALDADILGQMHLRVISIAGMTIPVQCLPFLEVRVISDFHTTSVNPLLPLPLPASHDTLSPAPTDRGGILGSLVGGKSLDNAKSSKPVTATTTPTKETSNAVTSSHTSPSPVDISKDFHGISESGLLYVEHITTSGKHSPVVLPAGRGGITAHEPVEMHFDLIETPAALIHQGPLPKSDLSKVVVKIQILYKLSRETNTTTTAELPEEAEETETEEMNKYIFLAGAKIPLVQILSKAHEGKLLDVTFEQRAVEVTVPLPHTSSQSSVTGEEEFKVRRRNKKKSTRGRGAVADSSSPSIELVPDNLSALTGFASHVQYVGDDITMVLPAKKTCTMSLSCIASHKLLQDWNLLVRKR